MAYLRMVLLGEWTSGKSSAGNTILGGSVFNTAFTRSAKCEVRHGEVLGRRLTVVESPGWNSNRTLQTTPEMDKLEIQNSLSLCPPGPHAVLLTVPLHKAFTKAQRVAIEGYMPLLSQSVWGHTIVLFTYGGCLGDRSIEQHIEAGGENLCWLVDKCGKRYHVFDNQKTDDTLQVKDLLEKLDQMVTGNGDGHYEVDGHVAEELSERKRNIEEQVLTLMTKTQRQRTVLKALFEGEHQCLRDVKLMMVGGDQISRTLAGNVILQENVFPKKMALKVCVKQQRRVADINFSVVMCPNWPTTSPSQKIKGLLLHGVTLCSPGPRNLLLNVPVWSNFSEADRRSVEEHMELLGDSVWRNTLVLFTMGWWLGGRCVEEYIESEGEPLRWILEKCGYRCHVLNGLISGDISDVTALMEKIEDMVMRNRGPPDSREDMSVRDQGHLREGHGTRQKTLFERLRKKKKKTFTAEEWNRREEEWKREEWKRREEAWRRREEELMNREEEGRRREEEWRRREEEWRRREEDSMTEKLLKLLKEEEVPKEPALPVVRRRNSKEHLYPSMSGGTPSKARSSYSWSPDKVNDWLTKRQTAPPSGYDTMTQGPSQPDTDLTSDTDEDDS